MRKVLMIPGPWHPIPPLKGAAVESIIYDLCKNIFLFETHIVSIKTPFHEHIETFAKHPFLRSVQGSVRSVPAFFPFMFYTLPWIQYTRICSHFSKRKIGTDPLRLCLQH